MEFCSFISIKVSGSGRKRSPQISKVWPFLCFFALRFNTHIAVVVFEKKKAFTTTSSFTTPTCDLNPSQQPVYERQECGMSLETVHVE